MPETERTQDGAFLNSRQQRRLVDRAIQQGYGWWLQEGSSGHVVVIIGHDIEHPYTERSLLIYSAGRATTFFLSTPGARLRRVTQRHASTLLSHQTL